MSIDPQMLQRVQDASQMRLEELSIFRSMILLTGFSALWHLELSCAVIFTDEAMIEVGAGSIRVFLEDLAIKNSGLDLGKLLQMVKARSRAGDGKHRNKATEFKSVTIRCIKTEDEVDNEILYFIEEIKLLGVDLNVIFHFVPHPTKESEQYNYY